MFEAWDYSYILYSALSILAIKKETVLDVAMILTWVVFQNLFFLQFSVYHYAVKMERNFYYCL